MKDTILALISSRQHVSFTELTRAIDGFKGDLMMLLGHDRNIVLWPWCSNAGIDALVELLSAKRIHLHPASDFTYMIDGDYPALPRVNRPPKEGYKEPHWFPVCFCDYPHNPKPKKK